MKSSTQLSLLATSALVTGFFLGCSDNSGGPATPGTMNTTGLGSTGGPTSTTDTTSTASMTSAASSSTTTGVTTTGATGATGSTTTGTTGATGSTTATGTTGTGGTGAGTANTSAGGTGTVTASSSTGGGTSGLVQPIEREGKYVLEFGATYFEVDPAVGGRVTQYSLNGQNILADETITQNATNWGSTFWPAPQREWDPTSGGDSDDWPPIDWLDSGTYTATLEGETIVLSSAAPPADTNLSKLSVVKRYSADVAAQAIDIEFILTNEDTVATSWAPWQVSRVAPNGLSFFPTGTSVVDDTLPTTDIDGITWFQHDGDAMYQPTPGQSQIADVGDPWVAHTDGSLVFVLTFPAITPADFAPGIGEVKLFAADTTEYEEVEILGPYTPLDPGESLSWSVRWYLRALPGDATAVAGDAALATFVRGLAQ